MWPFTWRDRVLHGALLGALFGGALSVVAVLVRVVAGPIELFDRISLGMLVLLYVVGSAIAGTLSSILKPLVAGVVSRYIASVIAGAPMALLFVFSIDADPSANTTCIFVLWMGVLMYRTMMSPDDVESS